MGVAFILTFVLIHTFTGRINVFYCIEYMVITMLLIAHHNC